MQSEKHHVDEVVVVDVVDQNRLVALTITQPARLYFHHLALHVARTVVVVEAADQRAVDQVVDRLFRLSVTPVLFPHPFVMQQQLRVVLDIVVAQILVPNQVVGDHVFRVRVKRTSRENDGDDPPDNLHEHSLRNVQVLGRAVHC